MPRTPENCFYVAWQPGTDAPSPIVGQRVALGDVAAPRRRPNERLFPIVSDPTRLTLYSSASRVFRVGHVTNIDLPQWHGWAKVGYCDGYLALEELPAAVAYGQRGGRVLSVIGQVERLTAANVEALADALPSVNRERLANRSAFAQLRGTDYENASQSAYGRIGGSLLSLAFRTSDDLWELWDGCAPDYVITSPRWSLAEYWAQLAAQSALVGSGEAERVWQEAVSTAFQVRRRPSQGASE